METKEKKIDKSSKPRGAPIGALVQYKMERTEGGQVVRRFYIQESTNNFYMYEVSHGGRTRQKFNTWSDITIRAGKSY